MNVLCICDINLLNKEANKENEIILTKNKNKFTKDLYKTNLTSINKGLILGRKWYNKSINVVLSEGST